MSVVKFVHELQPSRVTASFRAVQHDALWVTMNRADPGHAQNFSRGLLRDLGSLHRTIKDNHGGWLVAGSVQPVKYTVLRSAHPDYFSLGGDLSYFRECIRNRDAAALRDYSMSCVDMIYEWSSQMDQDTTKIALVQGRALGGGFEAALACDYIVAEEGSEFGFPEILFGLFPCTGGMSLLARRVNVYQAERMMTNGKMYSAAELRDMGIVDSVCPSGEGEIAVEKFIESHFRNRGARMALQRGRNRLSPLNYAELRTVVDEWVEAAMVLREDNLRVMDMLIQMQAARTTV